MSAPACLGTGMCIQLLEGNPCLALVGSDARPASAVRKAVPATTTRADGLISGTTGCREQLIRFGDIYNHPPAEGEVSPSPG